MNTAAEIIISKLERKRVKKKVPEKYQKLSQVFPITTIRTEKQYKDAMSIIRKLMPVIDQVSDKGVLEYFSALSTMAYAFEKTRRENLKSDPIEVIKYLMKGHNLTQDDLADELGGQSSVSLILSGARKLNLGHIKKLAERFKVSPAVFIKD